MKVREGGREGGKEREKGYIARSGWNEGREKERKERGREIKR